MNTACISYTASGQTPSRARHIISTWLGLARAGWTRWTSPRQPRKTEDELTALDGLTAETLKDIGAPEWLQDRARRSRERSLQGSLLARDTMHWR